MLPTPLLDETAREALRRAAAALDAAEAGGRAHDISLALADVAACYRGLKATASAESYYEAALRWARSSASSDQVVGLLCDLCETAVALAEAQADHLPGSGRAARERARDHAFEASTLAGSVADLGWEATVLLRISDVLDRCGDRDDATQLQVRALQLMSGSMGKNRTDHDGQPGVARRTDA